MPSICHSEHGKCVLISEYILARSISCRSRWLRTTNLTNEGHSTIYTKMNCFVRKIIGLFLALTLAVLPMRLAFADYPTAGTGHGVATQLQLPSNNTASHSVQHATNNHQIMQDMSCDTPCDKSHTNNDSNHCSSGTHCCMALFESIYGATHVAPYTLRFTLSVTLTSIIIPTATKPPRHSLLG